MGSGTDCVNVTEEAIFWATHWINRKSWCRTLREIEALPTVQVVA